MQLANNKRVLTLAVCSALTACNGDGGGGDSSTGAVTTSAVVLTDANQELVAQNAVGAVDTATTVSSSGAGLLSSVEVSGSKQQLQWPLLLARKGLSLMSHAPSPGLVGGAAISNTEACQGGGSIEFTVNDADNSNGMSRGDTVSARFTNCSETTDGVTALMNGGFSILLGDVSGDINAGNGIVNLSMSMPAPGLSIGVTEAGKLVTTTVIGGMNMNMQLSAGNVVLVTSSDSLSASSSDGESISYANFRMLASDTPISSNFSVDGDITSRSKDFSGAYTLSMSKPATPFVFTNNRNYPDSGELRIVGSNGTLTLTVQPNAMLLLTLNADGKTITKTVGWCSIGDC